MIKQEDAEKVGIFYRGLWFCNEAMTESTDLYID